MECPRSSLFLQQEEKKKQRITSIKYHGEDLCGDNGKNFKRTASNYFFKLGGSDAWYSAAALENSHIAMPMDIHIGPS
jgi:hypothetical protein